MAGAASDVLEWATFVDLLNNASPVVNLALRSDDPSVRQEAVRQLAASLAQGYYLLCHQDPDHPDFTNFIGPAVPVAAPNCDYMYHLAMVDSRGVYRIWGRRGTNLFAHIGFGSQFLGAVENPGPSLGHFDLDDMEIAPDGTFEIVLSAERPAGYEGNWVQMPAGAASVSVRNASYDWENEVDATYTIERLDTPVGRRPWLQEKTRATLEQLAQYPRRLAHIWLEYVRELHDDGVVNTTRMNRWAGLGGMAGQYYYEGLFSLAEDEALILEVKVPDVAPYWSVLLTDELFNSLDWVNTQSSLNGHQASIDADGVFRAVLCGHDPGIANWLDTSGRHLGCIQGRWKDCSSNPLPDLRLVKFDEIVAHLPGSRRITPEERDVTLRARRRGAQIRRKW